jgi:ABC-type multidrug transport system permease subunit
MDAQALRRYAAIVGLLAGVAAVVSGLVAHFTKPNVGYAWRPFITVFHNTAVFSAVGLLIGMGIIMIVGGIVLFRSLLWGGLLVVVPAIVGLAYCFTHEWHRVELLCFWAVPVVLAWVAGILAGYALSKVIEPYDEVPADDMPFRSSEGESAAS